jgi:DivIVA domain-containing protein
MQITGKELREVEFRDRLRGYDTDEVDEFLERVALAVDDMTAEIERLSSGPALQAPAAVPAPSEARREEAVPLLDDESIRRTLILAQRTADLAIKEAQAEAEKLTVDARLQADSMLSEAREQAQRLRSEAESERQLLIDRLNTERDQLERQVLSLRGLVEAERARLTEALTSMLALVGDTVTLSESLSAVADRVPTRTEAPRAPEPPADDPFRLGLADIDDEFADTAEEERFPRRNDTPPTGGTSTNASSPGSPISGDSLDPDEELWERWAKSAAEFGEEGDEDPFRLGDEGRPH